MWEMEQAGGTRLELQIADWGLEIEYTVAG